MRLRTRTLCWLILIPTLAIGCSNASKSPVPTAPTPGIAASTSSIDLSTTTPAGTPGAGIDKPVVGTVVQVTGSCPAALTFVVESVTVHVTADTKFEGGACGDLQVGIRAGAVGTKNGDGSINAAHVKVGPVPAPPPATAQGAVTGLAGTCPALTFTLAGTTVHTNASTTFEGGTCADVKEGSRVGAVGAKDATGALDAKHVKIAPPPLPRVTGKVAGLTGTCPAVTFTLGTTTVRTSATTRFEGRACTDLKNEMQAGAMGPKASDGAIDAQVVKIPPPK